MKRNFIFLNVIIPLFLGIIIYYTFFPEAIFVGYIDKLLPVSYHIPVNLENVAVRLLRFYLLDFLWAYALMSLIVCWLGFDIRIMVVIFLFIIIMELLQLVPFVQGTFDICDIFVEMFASILVILISRRRFRNEKR